MMFMLSQQVLKVIKWERDTLDASFLSHWLTEFFKGKPWNEYLMCPRCKSFDDFGLSHTYGVDEVSNKVMDVCPFCGTKMQHFWNQERIEYYLFNRPNSDGVVALVEGEVAGWCRGYPINEVTFYIDTVAILPQYRSQPGITPFLEEFINFLAQKRLKGYRRFITRTHKKAPNIRLLLRKLGFCENGPSEDDPERTYWILN